MESTAPEEKTAGLPALTTEQQALVNQHLDVVDRAVAAVLPKIDPTFDFRELRGYGYYGLVQATIKYKPEQGVPFPGFAWERVRGQILDEVRSSSTYTRSQRENFKKEQRLEFYHQRKMALTDTLEHFAAYLASSPVVHRVPLDDAARVVADGPSPESAVHISRIKERVLLASQELETIEREIVKLYYFEGKNLEEVGAAVGLEKSWTSRLLARALKVLQAALGRTPA
jgi:RNA polymerase sigma factor for flagellar operon FliA